jgi:ABC-type nitrate/sulfonate/bicarbonate transport system ATPase subunit
VSVDSLVVLKDINLNVKKGEFVCIIGDVASGKSSLLNTIIGDLIPVS